MKNSLLVVSLVLASSLAFAGDVSTAPSPSAAQKKKPVTKVLIAPASTTSEAGLGSLSTVSGSGTAAPKKVRGATTTAPQK